MSDGDAENIEMDEQVAPSATIDLDQEWVAWLSSEAAPPSVEGIDPSMDEIGGGSGVAVA